MQRSVVPIVSSVWVCPLTQQQTNHLSVPKRAGVVKGDQPSIITSVNTGSCLQQVLYDILPSKSCKRTNCCSIAMQKEMWFNI